MAADEILTSLCHKEDHIPTLRLYTWSPPAISIGYFQKANSTIDTDKCKRAGTDVVRRLTGGRAILHQDEITYSICASSEKFPELGDSVRQTYKQISLAFLEVLKILGIKGEWVRSTPKPKKNTMSKPCFVSSSKYEININDKKLIGSAQRRFDKVFLQHGSIPLARNKRSLAYFLPHNEDVNKTDKLLRKQSTSIQELLKQDVNLQRIIEVIKTGFSEYFKVRFQEQGLSNEELCRVEELIQEKYSKDWWNLLR